MRRDRQKERDKRHDQRMLQENREIAHHNGVHHSPTHRDNGNHSNTNYRPTLNSHGGSDDSENMSQTSSPQVVRSHISTSKYIQVRRSSSEDEGRRDEQYNYPVSNGHISVHHDKTSTSKLKGKEPSQNYEELNTFTVLLRKVYSFMAQSFFLANLRYPSALNLYYFTIN